MTITTRIAIGFGIFFVLVLVLGVTAYSTLSGVRGDLRRYFSAGDASRTAAEAEPVFRDLEVVVRDLLSRPRDDLQARAAALHDELARRLGDGAATAEDATDRRSLEDAGQNLATYWSAVESTAHQQIELNKTVSDILYPIGEQMRLRLEQALNATDLVATRLAGGAAVNIMLMRDYASRYLDRGAADDAQRVRTELALAKSRLIDLSRSLGPAAGRSPLGEVENLLGIYADGFERVVRLADDTDRQVREVIVPQGRALGERITELRNRPIARDASLKGRLDEGTEGLAGTTLAVTAAIALLGLLVAWLLARSITRPYAALSGALRALAEDRLDTAIPATNRTDEFGDMARALVRFREHRLVTERRLADTEQAQTERTVALRAESDRLRDRDLALREEKLRLRDDQERGREDRAKLHADQTDLAVELERLAVGNQRVLVEDERLRAESRRLDAEARRLIDEETRLGGVAAMLETLQESLHDGAERLRSQQDTLQADMDLLDQRRQALADLEERLKADDRRLSAEARRLADEDERLRAEAERLGAERRRLEADDDVQRGEQDRLDGDAAALQAEAERLAAEARGLALERQRLQGEVAGLSAEAAALRAEADRLRREEDRLRDEADRLALEDERLRGEADRLAGERERLRGENEDRQTAVARLAAEEERLAAEAGRLRGEADQLAEERQRLEADKEERRATLEWLAAEEERLAGEAGRLRGEAERLEAENARLDAAYHRLDARALDFQATEDQALEARAEFLDNLGRELRSPVNAIIGYSQTLLDEIDRLKAWSLAPDAELVSWAGEQLLGAIDSGLELARLEAGKVEVVLKNFDIADLIDDVRDMSEPTAELNGNTLVIDCPAGIGSIISDFGKLQVALINLLDRACKTTENGEIRLSAERVAEDGRPAVRFTVADTGSGLSAQRQATLFQPFAREDDASTQPFAGSSLGLPIAARFAQILGGTVNVASTPEAGTTVTLTVPSPEMALPVPAGPATAEDPADGEDHPDSRDPADGEDHPDRMCPGVPPALENDA